MAMTLSLKQLFKDIRKEKTTQSLPEPLRFPPTPSFPPLPLKEVVNTEINKIRNNMYPIFTDFTPIDPSIKHLHEPIPLGTCFNCGSLKYKVKCVNCGSNKFVAQKIVESVYEEDDSDLTSFGGPR